MDRDRVQELALNAAEHELAELAEAVKLDPDDAVAASRLVQTRELRERLLRGEF